MDGLEWLIVFTPARCSQCHGCILACQSWRGTEPGVRLRRLLEGVTAANSSAEAVALAAFRQHGPRAQQVAAVRIMEAAE